MPYTNVGTLSPCLGVLYPFLGVLYPFLGTLHSFLGMLYVFAATLCEGEGAIHEELRGHRALHGVPDPFRERGSECVGSSLERETTRPACVGMPREPLEMPNKDNIMRAAFLEMLHTFAARRCGGEGASHEESRGHHALHGVPDLSRGRRSECVGDCPERETTRPACVGMPRERRETPNGERENEDDGVQGVSLRAAAAEDPDARALGRPNTCGPGTIHRMDA
jgi:hypothetical protein